MTTPYPIEISEYSHEWPRLFSELGNRLRSTLGKVAMRIDHIGSTSIAGLAAKPIIDVQTSVGRSGTRGSLPDFIGTGWLHLEKGQPGTNKTVLSRNTRDETYPHPRTQRPCRDICVKGGEGSGEGGEPGKGKRKLLVNVHHHTNPGSPGLRQQVRNRKGASSWKRWLKLSGPRKKSYGRI